VTALLVVTLGRSLGTPVDDLLLESRGTTTATPAATATTPMLTVARMIARPREPAVVGDLCEAP
jgi:hypothetical protein